MVTPPQARRELKEAGKPYQPLWFVQQNGEDHHAKVLANAKAAKGANLTAKSEDEGFVWGFTGKYWEQRQLRDWEGVPDLYQ